MERGGRDADEFRERSIDRRVTKKANMRTKIGVPAMAPFAVQAGPSWVDGNKRARCKAGKFGEFRRNDAGELVPKHVRITFVGPVVLPST